METGVMGSMQYARMMVAAGRMTDPRVGGPRLDEVPCHKNNPHNDRRNQIPGHGQSPFPVFRVKRHHAPLTVSTQLIARWVGGEG